MLGRLTLWHLDPKPTGTDSECRSRPPCRSLQTPLYSRKAQHCSCSGILRKCCDNTVFRLYWAGADGRSDVTIMSVDCWVVVEKMSSLIQEWKHGRMTLWMVFWAFVLHLGSCDARTRLVALTVWTVYWSSRARCCLWSSEEQHVLGY